MTWALEETRRFFRAFHKYGTEFDKVSRVVGAGKGSDVCEALYNKFQAYLSLDKNYQSEMAFVEMVQDAEMKGSAEQALSMETDGHKEDETGSDHQGDATLAAGRARRTPKRPAPFDTSYDQATPGSGSKRMRSSIRERGNNAKAEEDVYYYDEGTIALQESARKRRLSTTNKRLDFDSQAAPPPTVTKRQQAADERKGIDALLALAADMDEKEEEVRRAGAIGALGALGGLVMEPTGSDEETDVEESEEEEEEDDAGARLEEDDDIDFETEMRRKGRRTPHGTPYKSAKSRPGSMHTTPRRPYSRLSPSSHLRGLGSPTLLAAADTKEWELAQLGVSDVAPSSTPLTAASSAQKRARRRKRPVEKSLPFISPIKSLFGRRQAGTQSLMAAASSLGYGDNLKGESQAAVLPGEGMMRHALNARARQWAGTEFFVSALDRPWYMNGGTLQDLAEHVGLTRNAKLTRKEWNFLRKAAWGRPRRLSIAFLREERARLEHWRCSVRACYEAFSLGDEAPDGIDLDSIPKKIAVGQRVTARHPTTRQLHDGAVLTAGNNCYRVQFDRRELGVELIKDIEVMPVEPYLNLPPAIARQNPTIRLNGRLVVMGESSVKPTIALPAGGVKTEQGPSLMMPAMMGFSPAMASMAAAAGPIRQMNAHQRSRMQGELAALLDKKEALLVQLRVMNDEAERGEHKDAVGGDNPAFVQAYATVILQLKDTNEKVHAKLMDISKLPGFADPLAVPGLPPSGLGAVGRSGIPAEEQQHVTTMNQEALETSAATEAKAVLRSVAAKLSEDKDSQGHADVDVSASAVAKESTARASKLIHACISMLVMLQQGTERSVPLDTLSSALESSIADMKHEESKNGDLYEGIEGVIKKLSLQLTSIGST